MARGGPRTEGRGGAEPDWLGSRDGQAAAPAEPRQERRKRRPRDDDEAEDEPKGKSKGIKLGPLIFLALMILPAMLPVLIDVAGKLEAMGVISIPSVQWMLQPSQYRSCLEEYYADWAPDKLGGIDTALAKYEGKEKQLFGALHRKYGKKVNLAKCSDK